MNAAISCISCTQALRPGHFPSFELSTSLRQKGAPVNIKSPQRTTVFYTWDSMYYFVIHILEEKCISRHYLMELKACSYELYTIHCNLALLFFIISIAKHPENVKGITLNEHNKSSSFSFMFYM